MNHLALRRLNPIAQADQTWLACTLETKRWPGVMAREAPARQGLRRVLFHIGLCQPRGEPFNLLNSK